MKSSTILNHPICRIIDDGKQYRVFIAMSGGGQLEHNPFPHDLRGLVAAMTLATDCLAGKFFPLRAENPEQQAALLALEVKAGRS